VIYDKASILNPDEIAKEIRLLAQVNTRPSGVRPTPEEMEEARAGRTDQEIYDGVFELIWGDRESL